MKIRVVLIMFATLFFVFATQAGFAEELVKRFALGARAGFYKLANEDIPNLFFC